MRCSTLTPPQDVAVKIINLEGISSDMEDIRKEGGRRTPHGMLPRPGLPGHP